MKLQKAWSLLGIFGPLHVVRQPGPVLVSTTLVNLKVHRSQPAKQINAAWRQGVPPNLLRF